MAPIIAGRFSLRGDSSSVILLVRSVEIILNGQVAIVIITGIILLKCIPGGFAI